MSEDALRQEISAEVRKEFESQIRELKRLKGEVEQQLDEAAERWRAERRRLNAEIDQLEENLSRAGRGARVDPAELRSKLEKEIQQTFEAQSRQAEAAWELERQALRDKMSRLEDSLTEVIARSNNPLRATQGVREHTASPAVIGGSADFLAGQVDTPEIDAEVQRVEAVVRAIEVTLEDEDTTPSAARQKNVEKAQQEAYLRGLRFNRTRNRAAGA